VNLILVDATVLVARVDARDALHRRARQDLDVLDGSVFATCEAVLSETCFHLSHHAHRLRLRSLLDELGVNILPAIYSRAYLDSVFDWLAKYAEHEPDWADGCLAVLSEQEATARVWTYDREFRTTWRRPDGKRIPMAVS
jgi:predicted nucleic acid-binding protein